MGFLSALLTRATPENPSFDLNSPEAWDALGASPSLSGVCVNAKTARSYSPWWRGINLLARDVGKLPLFTYKRQGEGKIRATDHPAYQLLRYKPNEWQTALEFRSQLTAHAVSQGNGYAFIDREDSGAPREMIPLDPDQTTPFKVNGQLWYQWRGRNQNDFISSANMLHIKGLSHDGMSGLDVVTIAKDAIGLGMGQAKQATVSIKNSARPAVVLEMPTTMTGPQQEELRRQWELLHTGPESAGRTAILQGGMTAKALAFSPEAQQFIEQRKFQLAEIANFLGIPPHKLGAEGRTAYASLEQENQSYLDDALDFWLSAWETQCWDKLLSEKEKEDDSHVIEFVRAALLRADITARSNYYRAALGGRGWMTVNEVRGLENQNPDSGEDSAKILTPLNMGQGGGQNQPQDPAASNVKPKGPNSGDRILPLIEDAEKRVRKRIATHALKAAKTPRTFNAWLDTLATEHGEAVRSILAPVYRAFHEVNESESDVDSDAMKHLDGLRAELLELSGTVSGAKLIEAVTRWSGES